MNKYLIIIIICLLIYVTAYIALYFLQEKLIFFPTKLSGNHIYSFKSFEEVNHKMEDGVILNSVLFKSGQRKGVVFFLHGNAGSIDDWGQGASLYVNCGYDVLYLDYRGYGKSMGYINNEKELIDDAQVVYDYLKNGYGEDNIIVSGTSIGTGIAAKIASMNNPRLLILNSPYYSLISLIKEKVPIVPTFIIKYSLETYKYLEQVKCPVTIFHGDKDELIPLKHSIDLNKKFEKADLNIIVRGGHNDWSNSETYRVKTAALLK